MPRKCGAQFRVYRTTTGYIRCDHPDGAASTGQDAREELQALASLTPGPSTPVLVDLRGTHSVSRDARRAFASPDVPSRIAMFVESPLSRVIANFFIGVDQRTAAVMPTEGVDSTTGELLHNGSKPQLNIADLLRNTPLHVPAVDVNLGPLPDLTISQPAPPSVNDRHRIRHHTRPMS